MKNDLITRGIGNWHTTAAGVGVGITQYLATQGIVLPHDKASWGSFVMGLIFAIWGVLQKDATTGSAPTAVNTQPEVKE